MSRRWRCGLSVWALLLGCDRAPALTGATAASGDLAIRDGVAWGLASSRSTTVGFRITAVAADTLVGVASADGVAMLHDNVNDRMTHLERLPIAAGASLVVGAGGPHIMLTETTHGYAPGDSVRLVLTFARHGALAITVPLFNFSDASGLLGR